MVGLTVVGALRVALAVLAEGGPLAPLVPVEELPGQQPHRNPRVALGIG
jgi:hypothetical protein